MARKTENDSLMTISAAPIKQQQMSLPLPVKSEPPSPQAKKQRANFEAFLEQIRKETQAIFLAAQMMFPGEHYGKAAEVNGAHWRAAKAAYEQRPVVSWPCEVPFPELWTDYVKSATQLGLSQPAAPKRRPQVYKPWPLERRQRRAVQGLLKRAKKGSSFPAWWITSVQAELLRDPWRFGVCPLPSEGICTIPDPDRILLKEQAIAREVQFREQEQGLVQVLQLPVNVARPDYAHAEQHRSLKLDQVIEGNDEESA